MACFQNVVHKLLFKLDGNCSGVGHAGTHSLLFSGLDNFICEIAAARAFWSYQVLVVLDEADTANAHRKIHLLHAIESHLELVVD
jgi:hypothetical protein